HGLPDAPKVGPAGFDREAPMPRGVVMSLMENGVQEARRVEEGVGAEEQEEPAEERQELSRSEDAVAVARLEPDRQETGDDDHRRRVLARYGGGGQSGGNEDLGREVSLVEGRREPDQRRRGEGGRPDVHVDVRPAEAGE